MRPLRLFDFASFSIHGVKFVTECTSIFLVLPLISFMAENSYSQLYVVAKRHIYNSGQMSLVHGKIHMSEAFRAEEG